MKILLAPDSFKGSLSSSEAIALLEAAAKKVFPSVEIVKLPIADGGEGTVEALVTVLNGDYRRLTVTGPLGEKVEAKYGVMGQTAVIEMAQASGLTLVGQERNPLKATTYGTGELIKAALDEGLRSFVIGIGGSATNDGGIGAMQALGVRFLDESGRDVGQGGQALAKISSIDVRGMDERIFESEIQVICDVENPLTGKNGATAIYGPQKGVTEDIYDVLENGMCNYARQVFKTITIDPDKIPGSGAAGGLGAALVSFCKAELRRGIDMMLDLADFDNLLKGVDLVVTGEGCIDGQSVNGKVPVGIAMRCKARNIPVVAIVGSMGEKSELVYDHGIMSIMTTVNRTMSLPQALAESKSLFEDAAFRMFSLIQLGFNMSNKIQ